MNSLIRIIFFYLLFSHSTLAHEIRPALLQITETQALQYSVIWKRPVNTGRTLNLKPEFPPHCESTTSDLDQVTGKAWISHFALKCKNEGLRNHRIAITGLSGTLTDALVRINWRDGSTLNHVLKSDAAELVIEEETVGSGLLNYLWLGVEHLLSGYDHVLFVVGLLYLGRKGWSLVKIVTSFTLAHSLTLGLSALDLVRLSQGPVEAVIALSILYLAVELMGDEPQRSLLHRRPWLIAFIFGLLHGFGFAGALRDIGLPEDSLLAALFLFNVGVEIGQLIIVALGISLMYVIGKQTIQLPRWVVVVPVWCIGGLSSYWFIDRTLSAFEMSIL